MQNPDEMRREIVALRDRISRLSAAILPVTGVISGLPTKDGTGATPQAMMARQCTSAYPAVPIREAKWGGSLPSTSALPLSACPSREWRRNCHRDSRLEKSLRSHRKASRVHMPPFVPRALPDRHETPLFCGQNQPPANGLPAKSNGRSHVSPCRRCLRAA